MGAVMARCESHKHSSYAAYEPPSLTNFYGKRSKIRARSFRSSVNGLPRMRHASVSPSSPAARPSSVRDPGVSGTSIGKLSLYVASTGIGLKLTLPIGLSPGTGTQCLLDDPTLPRGLAEARAHARHRQVYTRYGCRVPATPHSVQGLRRTRHSSASSVFASSSCRSMAVSMVRTC